MAEATTVARPYAEAAFEIAAIRTRCHWARMLRFARPSCAIRAWRMRSTTRASRAEKESLLLSIAGDNVTPMRRSFLRVLVERDRVGLLPEIAALFDALKDRAENAAKARSRARSSSADAQVADLKAMLRSASASASRPRCASIRSSSAARA
jgi:F-type H+-transporting ATPase subunit delta